MMLASCRQIIDWYAAHRRPHPIYIHTLMPGHRTNLMRRLMGIRRTSQSITQGGRRLRGLHPHAGSTTQASTGGICITRSKSWSAWPHAMARVPDTPSIPSSTPLLTAHIADDILEWATDMDPDMDLADTDSIMDHHRDTMDHPRAELIPTPHMHPLQCAKAAMVEEWDQGRGMTLLAIQP